MYICKYVMHIYGRLIKVTDICMCLCVYIYIYIYLTLLAVMCISFGE